MHDVLGDLIEDAVRRHPGKPAIVSAERTTSYAELDRDANRLFAALVNLGLAPGRTVGILARNNPDYPVVFLAVARAGGILVPLSVRSTASDIAVIAKRVAMSVLFVEPEFLEIAKNLPAVSKEILPISLAAAASTNCPPTIGALISSNMETPRIRIDPDAPSIIMFTSGTTGRPKGVTVSHLRYRRLMEQQVRECDIRNDDILQLAMPLFHNGGLVAVLGAGLAAGATVAFYSGSFEPGCVLDHARRHRVTIVHWIATMLARLTDHLNGRPADLPHLRCIHYGSMPTTQDLLAKVSASFPVPRLQIYATTDCGLIAVLKPGQQVPAADTTGRLLADTRTRIVDIEGNEVGLGEIGEVVVDASTSGMMGYWDEPELTARTIRDGWIYSGDLARRDRDGFITLVGRKDNLIISGGENVYPAEIEEVLAGYPLIREVIVCGVPDANFGEAVCAIVAAEKNALDLPALRAYCAGRLAAHKIPRKLFLVDALPRTASGKIARGAAKNLILDS
ncbi:MAG: acyl--CoA ligase [Bradyrhizobiaceae bacterium]|nr:acyl--CoA ligase [Bradyrhizobiaceae bacterium]